MELTLANEEDKKVGWTFDYKMLEQLQVECEKTTGFSPGLEDAEAVLIVLKQNGLLAEAVRPSQGTSESSLPITFQQLRQQSEKSV